MDEEEIAYKIVELYAKEVADPQEKRRMGLDTLLNAYFYSLLRLTRKKKEMEAFDKAITAEEQYLAQEEPMEKKDEETIPKMESAPLKPAQPGEEFKFD
ncbi:hypothetical protein K8R43_01155 [archaeon]|nr:hypothetical protein [archaeon]